MDKGKRESLENLKKDYSKLQKEYNLPDFNVMNGEFNIERISDISTDMLAREIRKFMSEKFSNYLRFVETLLNPSNSPMFVFSIVKSINADEKDRLQEIYKRLAKIEVRVIKNDLEFSREEEVKFIKESYKEWKEIKKEIIKIVGVIEKNWDKKFETNGKSYFG